MRREGRSGWYPVVGLGGHRRADNYAAGSRLRGRGPPPARSRPGRGHVVVGVLHRRRGRLRTGSVVAGRVHHRRGVFRRLGGREEPVGGQPVRLPDNHGPVRGPAQYQQKVLLFGIMAALGMRAMFIAVGAAAINLFTPTFLLFGLLLIWTAIQLVRHRNDDPDPDDDPLLRSRAGSCQPRPTWPADRSSPGPPAAHGDPTVPRLRRDRRSRPAVRPRLHSRGFGVTRYPFVVFSTNASACLACGAVLPHRGPAAAVRLPDARPSRHPRLHRRRAVPRLPARRRVDGDTRNPSPLSLAVILVVLAVTVTASLLRARTHSQQRAHAGALRAHGDHAKPGDSTGQAPPATRPGPNRHVGSPDEATTHDRRQP